ncbi:hypothetical protein DFH08DRAFT_976012 [Mycena albidolilacea]|uniref:Uncharacterized protein n=1 Tax=Mycena albidolilacea TaxID=1033008 RepID=A0AAD6Z4F6_9AGAR|nr:hypothetical protein DFH08DRAFT_976012 [Mycena albidolilacea]
MQFTRSILALVVVGTVKAAPGFTTTDTTLTKRWCGYQYTCKCDFNPATGCVPKFDECAQTWYWPPACTGCGSCKEICVDPFCPTA